MTVPSSRSADEPDAGAIAIAALSHFATEPKSMSRFFALTGLDPVTLRNAAGTPGFIKGLLDFVLAEPRVLQAIAEAQETTPEAIAAARARLDQRPMRDKRHDDEGSADRDDGAGPDEDWPPRVRDDWA